MELTREVELGPDHLLHLPEVPEGRITITVTWSPDDQNGAEHDVSRCSDDEDRRAAVERLRGITRDDGGQTLDEFLDERRADDRRRDKALGL